MATNLLLKRFLLRSFATTSTTSKSHSIKLLVSLSSFTAFAYYQQNRTALHMRFLTAQCDGGVETAPNMERPYLGVSLRSMIDKPGMMVLLVNTDSPAWHAGLKVGDILLEIDNQKINNITDYYAIIGNGSKKRRSFRIIRNGDEREI